MGQLAIFFLCNGLLLLGAWLLSTGWRHDPLERLLAAVVIGFGGMLGWFMLFALAGLSRNSSAASSTVDLANPLWFSVVWFVVSAIGGMANRKSVVSYADATSQPQAGWQRILMNLLAGILGWAVFTWLVRHLVLPVEPVSDGPIYHLYFAVRWFHDRSVEFIPTPFGELAATYFPANGSAWFCWLLTTFGTERFAKVGQFPFLLVSAAAIFGLGRRLGARPLAALIPAAVWTSTLAALGFAAVPNVDLIYTAFSVLGFYFLFGNLDNDERAIQRFALSWLAFGLALGTKTVTIPLILPWAVLASTWWLWRSTLATQQKLGGICTAIACCVFGCGFWFLRDIVATGNPLFPLHVDWSGLTLLNGCYTSEAMRNSAYHFPTERLAFFLDRMTILIDFRLVPIWGLSIATGCVCLLFSRRPTCQAATFLAIAAAAQFPTYWYFIPYNTQERFLLPALALGIVPLALILERWIIFAIPTTAVIVWHLFTPGIVTRMEGAGPDRMAPIVSLPSVSKSPAELAFAMVLPIVCTFAAFMIFSKRVWQRVLGGGALVAGLAFLVAKADASFAGEPLLRFYPSRDFATNLLPAWRILENVGGEAGCRVAYAGTNLPYYLYGSKLKNTVAYVDATGKRENWTLHDQLTQERLRTGAMTLADSPYPQWHRQSPDYDAWLGLLRQKKIDCLFVARENYHGRTDSPPEANFPVEYIWATDHPEVFERLGPPSPDGIRQPWAVVFRIRPGSQLLGSNR